MGVKKTSTGKTVQRKPKPELKWQTGDYDRHALFRFILPYQFLLLCKLMDITPEEMIRDFAGNLACENEKGEEKANEHLVNYFIACGYGQHHYSEDDIREMFKEMDALGLLFPKTGKRKLVDLYTGWRKKHHGYWFKKWFRKLSKQAEKK